MLVGVVFTACKAVHGICDNMSYDRSNVPDLDCVSASKARLFMMGGYTNYNLHPGTKRAAAE